MYTSQVSSEHVKTHTKKTWYIDIQQKGIIKAELHVKRKCLLYQ